MSLIMCCKSFSSLLAVFFLFIFLDGWSGVSSVDSDSLVGDWLSL